MTPTAKAAPGGFSLPRVLAWTAVGGAGAFFLLALVADWGRIGESLERFPPLVLLPLAGLSLLNYGLRYLKWQWYLGRLGHPVPHRDSLPVFLSGFAFTVTPGKVGEFVKAFFLRQGRGVPYSITLPVLLMDRFMDFFALFGLSALGLALGVFSPWFLALPLGLMVLGLLLLRSPGLMGPLLARLPLPARPRERIGELYSTGKGLLDWEVFLGGFALSALAWGAEWAGYWTAARALGADLPLISGVFIYSVSTVGGALSMLPGGLGVTEGGLAALGTAFGMSATVSAATAMVVRLMTLWFAVALGWAVLVLIPRLRRMLKGGVFA